MSKRKKELIKEAERVRKEYNNAFQHALQMNNLSEVEEYILPLQNKLKELDRELRFIKSPKYEMIPDYGELMTIEDFKETALDRSLIDYDGNGKYSDGKRMTDINVLPSDVGKNKLRNDFTHIVWFNR